MPYEEAWPLLRDGKYTTQPSTPTSKESLASIAESLKQIADRKRPPRTEMQTGLSATGSGSATLTITKPEPAELEDDGFSLGDVPSSLMLEPGEVHEFHAQPVDRRFIVVFGDYGNMNVDLPAGLRITIAAGTVPAQVIIARPPSFPELPNVPRLDDHR